MICTILGRSHVFLPDDSYLCDKAEGTSVFEHAVRSEQTRGVRSEQLCVVVCSWLQFGCHSERSSDDAVSPFSF